jgi:hypothetical protein
MRPEALAWWEEANLELEAAKVRQIACSTKPIARTRLQDAEEAIAWYRSELAPSTD